MYCWHNLFPETIVILLIALTTYLWQKDDNEQSGGNADESGAETGVVPLVAVDGGNEGVSDAP